MKKIFLIILFLVSGFVFSQNHKVKILTQKTLTSTERDAYAVPSGEYPEIYNSTTNQKECWDGDSWEACGSGTTNLGYISTATNGTVTSSTGDNAVIGLANGSNAGLLSPSEQALISSALQSGDNISELTNDSGYITSQTDDQTSSEVSLDTAINGETDAQGILEDHEARIDALAAGGSDGVVTNIELIGTTLKVDGTGGGEDVDVDLSSLQDGDTQLSDEQVQDKVGAMFSGNTETLITATYQDGDGTIDFVVDDDLSNYNNATSGFLDSSDLTPYLTSATATATYEPIFSKNTGFNKDFGTTSGTVAQGNDSRINNGQTAFGWGDHDGLYRPIGYVPAWAEITSKPTFGTVATSNSYDDLDDKPTIPTSPTPLTFIFSGQSNMDGGEFYMNDGGDKTSDTRVTIWDDVAVAWEVADLTQYPFGTLNDDSEYNNNLAFHIAKRIAEKEDRDVQIIFDAHSGEAISNWVGSGASSANWLTLLDKIDDSGVTEINGFFWHQGESDSGSTTYSVDLQDLIDQFRALPETIKNAPFIAGQLAYGYDISGNPQFTNPEWYGGETLNQSFFRQYNKFIEDPYFKVADGHKLATVGSESSGEGFHFHGTALVQYSYLYADAYYSAGEYNTDESLFTTNYDATTSTRADVDKFVYLDASSGSITVGLPFPKFKKEIWYKRVDNSTNGVAINIPTGYSINGVTDATYNLFSKNDVVVFKPSSLTNYDIISFIPANKTDFAATTAIGATATENGADTWAKIATYSLNINNNDLTSLLSFTASGNGNSGNAIVSVAVRRNTGATSLNLGVDVLAMSSNNVFDYDSFKLVATDATDIELWVRKISNYSKVSVLETNLARSSTTSRIVYETDSAWQSTEPTGTYSAQSSGSSGYTTPSELLTAIKTVDGNGSGLDADNLDGLNSTVFARLDTNSTKTGGSWTLNNNLSLFFGTSSSSTQLYSNGTNTFFNQLTGDFKIQDNGTDRFTFGRTTGNLAATSFNGVSLTTGGSATNFLNEQGNYVAVSGGGTDDQTASEVPFTPYLTITSTDTQSAIEELKNEVDGVSSGDYPTNAADLDGYTNSGNGGSTMSTVIGSNISSTNNIRIREVENDIVFNTDNLWFSTKPNVAAGVKIDLTNLTASRDIQFPDATGIIALEADPSGFDGNLSTSDNTLQEIAQKLDDLSIGGGGTVDVVSNVATSTILGRTTAGSGNSEELTPAQVRTLLNVEDAADVTDTANVTSAGALMDSEVTNLAQVKAFDSSDYANASHTHTASNIIDFDTEVSNNSSVTANTAKRGVAYLSAQLSMTQSGSSDPTVTVKHNDTGETYTVTRTGTGSYLITSSGSNLTLGDAHFISTNTRTTGGVPCIPFGNRATDSTIVFQTSNGTAPADSLMLNILIEIRIYP